jgi:hypothetical protein
MIENNTNAERLLLQLILTEMMSENLRLLEVKSIKNLKLRKCCNDLKLQITKEFNCKYYQKFDELVNSKDLINYQNFYQQFINEFVNSSIEERDKFIKLFLENKGHSVIKSS